MVSRARNAAGNANFGRDTAHAILFMYFMVQEYLAQFITIFTQILIFAIFVRVIMSWLRVPPKGFLFAIIIESTEPILSVFRRLVPPVGGFLDLSPLLAFLALDLLRSLLLRLLA